MWKKNTNFIFSYNAPSSSYGAPAATNNNAPSYNAPSNNNAPSYSAPSPSSGYSSGNQISVREVKYNLGHPLIRDVLFCFLSEVLVTNWAAQ